MYHRGYGKKGVKEFLPGGRQPTVGSRLVCVCLLLPEFPGGRDH